MERDQPGTKERILHAAYELFYRQGFTRVSVDAIADRARVTKRTVYYHFDSKDALIAGVLGVMDANLMRQFRDWIGPEAVTAPDVVARVFARLGDWADRPGWLGSGFTRITSELADMRGHPARTAASRHKAAVENWLAGELGARGAGAPERLAREVMILIEGAMALSLIHGDTGYIRAAGAAALTLVGNGRE